MILSNKYVLSVAFTLCFLTGIGHAREYQPVDPNNKIQLSKHGTFVLQGLLGEMGLALPDHDKKIDPPKPTPQPKPKPNKKDDFFDGDDGFFDGEVGFDAVVDKMDQEYDKTVKAWDKEYEEMVAQWDKARKVYVKNKEKYLNAAIPATKLEQKTSKSNQFQNTKARISANIGSLKPGQFHVIPGALTVQIKNQGYRGTCAAFSGVRAIETILAQNNIRADLSEQHFYFLSKPKCQQYPCNKAQEGSSLSGGFIASSYNKNTSSALIPEGSCPYTPYPDYKNITYTPLRGCKSNGVVKSGKFYEYKTNLNTVLNELRNNIPVTAGFTLTKSYHETKGLVKYNDPSNIRGKGMHDGGHANLLIGYIKLPENLAASEGRYCMITANSWADGWGRGGYACLTEKWLSHNAKYFTSLRSVYLTEKGKRYYSVD